MPKFVIFFTYLEQLTNAKPMLNVTVI